MIQVQSWGRNPTRLLTVNVGCTILPGKLGDNRLTLALVTGVEVVEKQLEDALKNIYFHVTGGENGFSDHLLPDEFYEDEDAEANCYPDGAGGWLKTGGQCIRGQGRGGPARRRRRLVSRRASPGGSPL